MTDIKRNRLSDREKIQLAMWLTEKKESFLASRPQFGMVVDLAVAELGFNVLLSNLKHVMSGIDLDWEPLTPPKTRTNEAKKKCRNSTMAYSTYVMGQALIEVVDQMGGLDEKCDAPAFGRLRSLIATESKIIQQTHGAQSA